MNPAPETTKATVARMATSPRTAVEQYEYERELLVTRIDAAEWCVRHMRGRRHAEGLARAIDNRQVLRDELAALDAQLVNA